MNPKPYAVLMDEGRSHRTKAELETRKAAEEAALTGVQMRETPAVKADPAAHKCFVRIRKLMKSIGKADAMYEAVVNRYCILTAEVEQTEKNRARVAGLVQMLEEKANAGALDLETFLEREADLLGQTAALDKVLQQKRKMLLEIEKECMMTVAAALRAIPKKPPEPEADPMAEMLQQRRLRAN